MAFKRNKRSRLIETALDMTPLIDVVFLLVIFLLISTTFKKKQLALELNLPRAGTSEFKLTGLEHTLRIDSAGTMFLCPNEDVRKNEDTDALQCATPTNRKNLEAAFKELVDKYPGMRVGVYAASDAPYHWIVKVVAAATDAGLDLNLPYRTGGE